MFGLELLRNLFRPRPTPSISPLAGKPLRYLIGADKDIVGVRDGLADVVTEVPYDAKAPARAGISIAYCNFFDQRESYDKDSNTGDYGPYLPQTDTAEEYDEGVIDPRGPGWSRNLIEQFAKRQQQGFEYIELDNPDAYEIEHVIDAIYLAAVFGLKVIAKNPELTGRGATRFVEHPNVYGMIVEKDAGNPREMDVLRRDAGKPDLPVWFVAFDKGRQWANDTAKIARSFPNMRVTYSPRGEYETSIDINQQRRT